MLWNSHRFVNWKCKALISRRFGFIVSFFKWFCFESGVLLANKVEVLYFSKGKACVNFTLQTSEIETLWFLILINLP